MPDPTPPIVTLTAPQARALRFYGTPHPRTAHAIGGLPRWDVARRLAALGLLEQLPNSFDHRLTEAGRAQLVVEAGRRGWPLPWHRQPYVGEGADGARRSAQIDREEADGLDRVAHRPGIERLLASAERWEAQAAELESRVIGRGAEQPVERPVRIAVDADCPGCGYPERSFDPTTGMFACSSLNRSRCDYESTERDR